MTRLAQAARRAGAEWVVPFDADELWFATDGLLGDRLRAQRADVLGARLFNAFPTRAGGWAMDPTTGLGKVAFRSHPLASVGSGNPRVDRPGRRLEDADAPLRIAHLPWRSFEQFAAAEAGQGAPACGSRPGCSAETTGATWAGLTTRPWGACGRACWPVAPT